MTGLIECCPGAFAVSVSWSYGKFLYQQLADVLRSRKGSPFVGNTIIAGEIFFFTLPQPNQANRCQKGIPFGASTAALLFLMDN
ncbi:MAG: hypothetical protein H6558_15515 [Lewinellaceae bacterium]|nr:hypothetical protein [Lewinellaceae bacterium]